MEASKRILITGINGFIGSRVAKAMIDDGFVVDGLSLNTVCKVAGVHKYISLPIEDEERVAQAISEGEYYAVVHLAAIVHKKSNEMTQAAYDRVNHRASANIFRAAAKSGVKRILFASTVEVYGNTPDSAINETTPTSPTTFYGKSKLAAEKALEEVAQDYGIEYAIMRFAPVYAPSFKMNIDKRIYLPKKFAAYYFKDGSYSFHFVSIDNIVSATLALMNAGNVNGIYLMADKSPFTAMELIELEKKHSGLKIVLKMPYALAYAGIWVIDKFTKMMEPRDIFLSLYNFNKIFKSTHYDISHISGLCDMHYDLNSTIYNIQDGGAG